MSLFARSTSRALNNQIARTCCVGSRLSSSSAGQSSIVRRRFLYAALAAGGVVGGTLYANPSIYRSTSAKKYPIDNPESRSSGPRDVSPPYHSIPYGVLQQHDTAESCWILIDGQIYDVTEMIRSNSHPGGTAALLKFGGKDATEVFHHIHRTGNWGLLPPEAYMGPVNPATVPPKAPKPKRKEVRMPDALTPPVATAGSK